MKKIFYTIAVFISALLLASCDDMNSVHQEFLDRGAGVQVGRPIIEAVKAGFERVEVEWMVDADPKIYESRISYTLNGEQHTVSVPVDPNRTESLMTQIIEVPEGVYVFEMVNVTGDGFRSLRSSMSGRAFGETFQNRLRNRAATVSGQPGNATITFSVESGVVETRVTYVNNQNEEKVITIPGNQTTLNITDFLLGSTFTHSSFYRPERDAIDLIPSNPATGRLSMGVDLDRTAWTVTTDQGNGFPNAPDGTTGLPMHMLNDNTAQFLSLFKPGGTIAGQTAPPIDFSPSFTVDLQESNPFNYFRWQHRQGNNGQQLRAFAVNLYGSNDGDTFTQIMPATPAAPLFPSLFWIPVTNGYTGADAVDSQYYYIDVPESTYRYVQVQIMVWSNKYRVDPPTGAYPTIYQHPSFPGNAANGWGNAVQIGQFGLGWFYN
jgi:hypothetical protein